MKVHKLYIYIILWKKNWIVNMISKMICIHYRFNKMETNRRDMSIDETLDERLRESDENIGFEKAGSEKPGDWRIFASSSLLIQ